MGITESRVIGPSVEADSGKGQINNPCIDLQVRKAEK